MRVTTSSAAAALGAQPNTGSIRRHFVSMCSTEDVAMKNPSIRSSPDKPFDLELDDLLHPAGAFEHPRDVVSDPDLTLNEKRAILASWASDACAMEAAPALRNPPGCSRLVPVDDILEALCSLDKGGLRAGGRLVMVATPSEAALDRKISSATRSGEWGFRPRPRALKRHSLDCGKRGEFEAQGSRLPRARRFTRGQSNDFRLSRPV